MTPKLTAEQQQKIRKIEAEMFAELPPKPHGRGGRGGGPPHRMEEAIKQAVERILDLLHEDQKAKWLELTGEPFAGATTCPAPPGSFGPR